MAPLCCTSSLFLQTLNSTFLAPVSSRKPSHLLFPLLGMPFYCRPQRQGQLLGGAFPSAHCLPPCLLQPACSGCSTTCLVLPVQFRRHRICDCRITPHAMRGNCTEPIPATALLAKPPVPYGCPRPAAKACSACAHFLQPLRQAARDPPRSGGVRGPATRDAAWPAARPVRTRTERGRPAAALTRSALASELSARSSPPSPR